MRDLLDRRAVRSVGLAAGVTSCARVAGLLAQALLVARFGAGVELDSFLLTLIVPALLVVPLAGGFELALPAAYARAEREDLKSFRNRVFKVSAMVAVVVTILVLVASPFLVLISGPAADPEVVEQGRALAPLVYAGVGFRIMSAAATGLLIGAGRITAPVVARLANPAAFVVFLLASPSTDPQLLAIANLIGDVLEATLTVGMVFVHTRRTPAGESPTDIDTDTYRVARRSFLVVLPSMVLVQLVPVVDQAFVSSLGAGSLTIFFLATRMFDSVRSIVVVPFLRVAQRRLATAAVEGREAVETVLRNDRRRATWVGGVAAAVLAIGGPATILLAFENGSFGRAESLAAIRVTLALVPAVGLAVLHGQFGRAFVALGDTRRANGVMVMYVVVNLVLDAALIRVAGVPGVALATATSLAVTVTVFRRAVDGLPQRVIAETA